MPKVRRNNKKQPPEGWELIEPTLEVHMKVSYLNLTCIKRWWLLVLREEKVVR